MTFAAHLRCHRTRAGLSQAALARAIGHTHGAVSRLESGSRNASRATVEALAGALSLGALEGDRLLLSAGYAPRDLVGLVACACSLVANLSADDNTGHYAAEAAWYLTLLMSRMDLMPLDGDLNAIAREGDR